MSRLSFTRRSVLRLAGALPLWATAAWADAPPLDVLQLGAKGDGETDDTPALLAAHALGRPLHYPKPSRFYRITRPLPVSASVSGEGSEVRIRQDGTSATAIFTIKQNPSPIRISGMVLDGGYQDGAVDEASAGVEMYGAQQVAIVGNTIRNMYGDCIYVGSRRQTASSDILIVGNDLSGPRRCNVAVVCGLRVEIRDNRIAKPNTYVAAIDLEPNRNGFDLVQDVLIQGNRFNTVGDFLEIGVSNRGRINDRVRVLGNEGDARRFLYISSSAELVGAVVSRNTFRAHTADGAFADVAAVRLLELSDNVDLTPCGGGYRSVRAETTGLRLKRNRFCS